MLPSAVATISRAEEEKTRAVFTLAFVDDPVMRWMLPEANVYLKDVADAQLALGGRAIESGSAYKLDDFAGAALWLPPGIGVDEEAMSAFIENSVSEKVRADLFGVVEQMGQFHPHEPHWYLAVLGVDANRQGKGFGSVLMKHALQRIDREGSAAYLESSNPRNIPFYERHGFEVIGQIQSGSSPVVTPMLRPAR